MCSRCSRQRQKPCSWCFMAAGTAGWTGGCTAASAPTVKVRCTHLRQCRTAWAVQLLLGGHKRFVLGRAAGCASLAVLPARPSLHPLKRLLKLHIGAAGLPEEVRVTQAALDRQWAVVTFTCALHSALFTPCLLLQLVCPAACTEP